jgi:uncharacterized damage-inducible protein DinB
MSDLTEDLAESRKALLAAAGGVQHDRAAKRPDENSWSVLEVLAHLIDVDYHWLREAVAMRDEPGHLFIPFDDERWKAEHANIRETPVSEILDRLSNSHAAVTKTFAAMSDEELDRPGRHPSGRPCSARDVFQRFPRHDENHERQIREILAAL